MYRYSGGITIGLALLAGMMLGGFLFAWWQERKELANRRIPKRWPLSVRSIVNSQERRTWRWLVRSFLDHHVLVKIPVTRFTKPQVREQGQHWFHLLSGIYCTFTICTPEGSVIACVDVPGPEGLSLSNRTLKQTLLSQCNIRYWVVDPEDLPGTAEIRTAFLGDQALRKEGLEGAFDTSRANLQAALLRNRHQKNSGFSRLDAALVDNPDSAYDSRLSTGWQENSFVTPLDSRSAELR